MGLVIPHNAQRLIDALEEHGHEAFMVGGSVRDEMLGRQGADVDITTSCPANLTMQYLQDAGFAVYPTGIKHGTVTAVVDGTPFEVTTYRVDGSYTDSRHPDSVRFSTSIEEDLARRDFTVNAMAFNSKRGLIDPFGGRLDLEAKTIRCVGDPDRRFSEDALRILRALRFSSQLGFSIEDNTSDSLVEKRELLKKISPERIGKEFSGLIAGTNAASVLRDYREVFEVFIPEIRPMVGLDQKSERHIYDAWEHSLVALQNQRSNDAATRFATLFHDFGKPEVEDPSKGDRRFEGHAQVSARICRSIMKRLRLTGKLIGETSKIIEMHDTHFDPSDYCVRMWMGQLTPEVFFKILDLKRADISAHSPKYAGYVTMIDEIEKSARKALDSGECIDLGGLRISGRELTELGYEKGPIIGTTLKWLLDLVLRGELENEPESLKDAAKSRLNEITKRD